VLTQKSPNTQKLLSWVWNFNGLHICRRRSKHFSNLPKICYWIDISGNHMSMTQNLPFCLGERRLSRARKIPLAPKPAAMRCPLSSRCIHGRPSQNLAPFAPSATAPSPIPKPKATWCLSLARSTSLHLWRCRDRVRHCYLPFHPTASGIGRLQMSNWSRGWKASKGSCSWTQVV
jgi:hypothetical protein